MGTRHLTRKEIIQEDKIHSVLARSMEWFTDNSRYLTIAAAIVLVLFGGFYLWNYFSRSTSERLQAQFGDALAIYGAPAGADRATSDPQSKYSFATPEERYKKALAEFSKIAEDSPRSDIGQFARYYVALNQHKLGRTSEARKTLQALLEDTDQPMVKTLAANYLAQLSEAEKNNQKAVEFLTKALQDSTPGFPKSAVLFRLGQNYEAMGKAQDAVKQYKRIVTEFPDSPESQQAKARIEALPKETAKK
ncbi:MAG: tetratricopeptide repeat protein [Acidobacteriota bacterium]